VVHDHFEQDQARMHLDCVFNILGRDCVVRSLSLPPSDERKTHTHTHTNT
jgi:arginine deiminase